MRDNKLGRRSHNVHGDSRECSSRAHLAAEQFIEAWQRLAQKAGGTRAHRFVPLVGSAFLFILFANWIGALPLKHIKTINPDGNSVELIRSATSDLNLTVPVALMVVVLVEGLEVRSLGLRHYLKGLVVPNPMRWLSHSSCWSCLWASLELDGLIGPERDIPAPDLGTNVKVMAWMMDTSRTVSSKRQSTSGPIAGGISPRLAAHLIAVDRVAHATRSPGLYP